MQSFDELFNEIRSCATCPFNPKEDARYCGGYGDDHRVMFIAESPSTSGGPGVFPGKKNFYFEEPATDADKLFGAVRECFGLEKCYTTDLVKCGVASGKPDLQKVMNCLPYLKREIELVRPRVVVAVGTSRVPYGEKGSVPFAAFLKEKLGLTVPVIATWHYSYVWRWSRNGGTGSRMQDHIDPAKWAAYKEQHESILKHL